MEVADEASDGVGWPSLKQIRGFSYGFVVGVFIHYSPIGAVFFGWTGLRTSWESIVIRCTAYGLFGLVVGRNNS